MTAPQAGLVERGKSNSAEEEKEQLPSMLLATEHPAQDCSELVLQYIILKEKYP